MKRRLFLTGAMGAGKSTAIAQALGDAAHRGGGFFTRRCAFHRGHPSAFSLESPDGTKKAVFLEFHQGQPVVRQEVFSSLGVSLVLDPTVPFVILDEIGGVELLCPEFVRALEALWRRNTPCIGVIKEEGPAAALANALALEETYLRAADGLRRFLREDPDTLVYRCGQFDETAQALARAWCREYAYEGIICHL